MGPPPVVTGLKLGEFFFRLRFARVLGLAFFVAGASRYRSYENRQVLGLWSYPFFFVIVAGGGLLVFAIVRSWQMSSADPRNRPSLMANLMDLGFLSWGGAYFLSALDAPVNGGRVLDLNSLGSVMPAAAMLEWAALALFFLAGALTIPKLGGKWAKVGLAVGSVLLVGVVAEGVARIKVAIAPVTHGYPSYSSEAWARRYVQLNSEGFRDVDHALSATAGTRRLLIVGDSVAFGWGIPGTEDRLGEQLAARLNAETGKHWELLNASLGDTHTLDHIRFLERMQRYRPDVVVLLYVFNDIDYLAPVTRQDTPFGRSILGRLNPLWILYKNSYAFQEIFVRGRRIYYLVRKDERPDPYRDAALLSRHFVDLARFQSIATQGGATFELVPIDIGFVLEPKLRDRYRNFVQQAQTSQIPVCSLGKAFDGFAYRDLTVNALDGHPNEKANRLAADVVAECLLKEPGK